MTQGLTGAIIDSAVNYSQPVNAFSITLNDTDWHVILDSTSALASGTITMNPNPYDGQIVDIRTSQTITTLTINGNAGQTIKGYSAGTLTAGGRTQAIYKASNTTWFF